MENERSLLWDKKYTKDREVIQLLRAVKVGKDTLCRVQNRPLKELIVAVIDLNGYLSKDKDLDR